MNKTFYKIGVYNTLIKFMKIHSDNNILWKFVDKDEIKFHCIKEKNICFSLLKMNLSEIFCIP